MNAETPKRSGRPDQQASEELLRHIVDTATRLFIDQGYAATSIEQIASAAGSGKQTLYRRFVSKEGLFTEVINRQGQRLVDLAVTTGEAVDNPVVALKESCRLLFDFVLTPDMIRLQRILVAEISRFPDLGEKVLDNCMSPFKDMLNRLLGAASHAGAIHTANLDLTHNLMIGLMTGWPVQQALLGRPVFETEADREAYFEAAWALFLRGAQ